MTKYIIYIYKGLKSKDYTKKRKEKPPPKPLKHLKQLLKEPTPPTVIN